LIKGDGVELVPGHAPPSRQHGADQQIRGYFFPNQGLNVFRSNRVFLSGYQLKPTKASLGNGVSSPGAVSTGTVVTQQVMLNCWEDV
jgi:hypothetical protein